MVVLMSLCSSKRLDGGKLENASTRGFAAKRGRSKDRLDEERPFIRGGRRSDITPERDDIQVCIITCSAL